jgi:competence protein ComEA
MRIPSLFRLRALVLSFLLLLAPISWGLEVNLATEAQLDGIKGVGPATTRLILAARRQGPFADWADLRARVKGVGTVRASQWSAQGVTVNGQSWLALGVMAAGAVPPAAAASAAP